MIEFMGRRVISDNYDVHGSHGFNMDDLDNATLVMGSALGAIMHAMYAIIRKNDDLSLRGVWFHEHDVLMVFCNDRGERYYYQNSIAVLIKMYESES